MSMKLYVGNLSFNTSGEDLQELFAQVGTVESATVVEDRETGRSRGFGFVEMSSKEEGQAAIQQFNGKEVGGRALNVNEAKPREERGGGNRGGFGGGRNGGGARRWLALLTNRSLLPATLSQKASGDISCRRLFVLSAWPVRDGRQLAEENPDCPKKT